MLDAVVGAVIMVIATTSLLSAIEVIEKAFVDAGRQPLSPSEKRLLERVDRLIRSNGISRRSSVQLWYDSD